jgi:C4-dicarboxylate-specific signal transduction histidine kinase
MADTVERASSLTRQLLLFSRKDTPRSTTLDVNEIVRRCEQLLARALGQQVALRMDLDERIGQIRGVAIQVEQIIVNLCVCLPES